MDQNITSPKKWETKIGTISRRAKANEIWPLFEDFFGIDKWFPSLTTCHGIHGVNGEPGCIRYCSGFGLKRVKNMDGSDDSNVTWSKEKLVAIDRDQMTLTYEMLDSNIGFKSYVSTIKVVEDGDTCAVEWSISLDPVVGWKFDDLVNKYVDGLVSMVRNMEASIYGLA